MKLTKAQEKKLVKIVSHITGECNCPATSRTCAYWKNVDRGGADWQAELIVKEIKKL